MGKKKPEIVCACCGKTVSKKKYVYVEEIAPGKEACWDFCNQQCMAVYFSQR